MAMSAGTYAANPKEEKPMVTIHKNIQQKKLKEEMESYPANQKIWLT